jgi:SAM-dependent methyltransferase
MADKLLKAMGQNLHRKKRERRAESKYDHNYFDSAFDHRDKVVAERRLPNNFVGQRFHLYDTDHYWNDKYYIRPDDHVADQEDDAYADLRTTMAQLDPYLDDIGGFRILIIGCGLSGLARELKRRGFVNVANVDSSAKLVAHMLQPADLEECVDAICADATSLYMYPDAWFDLVVDKAMLDTLFTKTSMMTDVPEAVDEISRVLAPGGTYFIFSVAPPAARQSYLERKPLHWKVRCGKSTAGIFTYACTQPRKPSEVMNYFE